MGELASDLDGFRFSSRLPLSRGRNKSTELTLWPGFALRSSETFYQTEGYISIDKAETGSSFVLTGKRAGRRLVCSGQLIQR